MNEIDIFIGKQQLENSFETVRKKKNQLLSQTADSFNVNKQRENILV